MGKELKGVYNLQTDNIHVYTPGSQGKIPQDVQFSGLHSQEFDSLMGPYAEDSRDQIELVKGATHEFDQQLFLAGKQTPVYFGTALANFGVRGMVK